MKTAEEILMEWLKGGKGRNLTERNAVIAAMEEYAEQVKNCNIPQVSQQSELLVAFCDYMAKEGGNGFIDKYSLVEDFLKATNCG